MGTVLVHQIGNVVWECGAWGPFEIINEHRLKRQIKDILTFRFGDFVFNKVDKGHFDLCMGDFVFEKPDKRHFGHAQGPFCL